MPDVRRGPLGSRSREKAQLSVFDLVGAPVVEPTAKNESRAWGQTTASASAATRRGRRRNGHDEPATGQPDHDRIPAMLDR